MTRIKHDKGETKNKIGGIKRGIDEISNTRPDVVKQGSADFIETGENNSYVQGIFKFRFQEGHSKNFKRELEFDWFLQGTSLK